MHCASTTFLLFIPHTLFVPELFSMLVFSHCTTQSVSDHTSTVTGKQHPV